MKKMWKNLIFILDEYFLGEIYFFIIFDFIYLFEKLNNIL